MIVPETQKRNMESSQSRPLWILKNNISLNFSFATGKKMGKGEFSYVASDVSTTWFAWRGVAGF